MSHPQPATDLVDRYGRSPSWHRAALLAVVGALIAVFLGWVGWVAWFHGSPDVTSELVAYDVVSEHAVEAKVDVNLGDAVGATCKLRALAEDHSAVGELSFPPVDGLNRVTIRTERRATSVEKVGCTTEDQPQPR